MYSKSYEPNSKVKMFAKPDYSMEIEVEISFLTNAAIYALQKGLTSFSWLLLVLLSKATYTTKILCPGSRAIITNSFFLTISTCLVEDRTFLIV